MNIELYYIPFVEFDVSLPQGFEYGPFNMVFALRDDKLHVKCLDTMIDKEEYFQAPSNYGYKNPHADLCAFLLDYFSKPRILPGPPIFLSSIWMSEDLFNNIYEKSRKVISAKSEAIFIKESRNELILFLLGLNLEPVPTLFDDFSWKAKCISGRNHPIYLSTDTNTWGCGYCHRKGGLSELKNWWLTLNN
jgi:hypothetical protein